MYWVTNKFINFVLLEVMSSKQLVLFGLVNRSIGAFFFIKLQLEIKTSLGLG